MQAQVAGRAAAMQQMLMVGRARPTRCREVKTALPHPIFLGTQRGSKISGGSGRMKIYCRSSLRESRATAFLGRRERTPSRLVMLQEAPEI